MAGAAPRSCSLIALSVCTRSHASKHAVARPRTTQPSAIARCFHHARRRAFAAEHYSAIHDDPLPVVRRPEAIGIEVHADLARAAQREEDKLVMTAGSVHCL